MVGIDLLDPTRLAERLQSNPELRDALFLAGEITYAESRRKPILHLAARFAAKEAVMKALGVRSWDPLEVEITGGGEDVGLRLHGEMEALAEALEVDVTISMTHIDSLVGAIAMAHPSRCAPEPSASNRNF